MDLKSLWQRSQLLPKAKQIARLYNWFNEEIDKVFCNYLSYFFKVSLCIYHDIGDLNELKKTQFEINNEFKTLCENFLKFKRLIKINYLPCKNRSKSLTIGKKFKFSFSYEDSKNFIIKEDLDDCIKIYLNSEASTKPSDVDISYMYNHEFKKKLGLILNHY